MKTRTVALMFALCLLAYAGLCAFTQYAWDIGCSWYVPQDTPVYTPGTADEIAVTLPAGTGCRVDESVGDTWQSIEYMINGQTYTGMVRADSISLRAPYTD